MAEVDVKKLSEEDMLNLEDKIPVLAASATLSAYYRALSSGLTVYRIQGSNMVEAKADGSVRVIAPAKPRTKVLLGKVHKVRRLKASA
ncbi:MULTISPECIES: hypothetical protein [unclassified Pseudomonas]|uniref:hypothetical protein n=1 Tax=unclassified Pseudomonas TaxID=196821 RepID=UPI00177EFB36|nr:MULTISPECIES: hypothetical protein [unclassified Pseudomonas]MBD8705247.1 hypothetical protein [Pseudomonas sp. CFBP 13711]MBD8711639.1 hypothetical protein [Pseudomonas sp. CFBP 13715]